jgi:hypothetical protein
LSVHIVETTKIKKYHCTCKEFASSYVRSMNGFTKDEFQSELSTESWEDIFEGSDTNVIQGDQKVTMHL